MSASDGDHAIRAVDHDQLPLPLGASAQARVFYERLLGLRELRDPTLDRPGSLHYALGWGRLDLSEGLYAGVAPQVGLATIVRRLRQAGVAVDEAPMFNAQRAFVVDPFGNRLELIEPARNPELESFHVSDIRISV